MGLPLKTWDTQLGDIMFFCTRPPQRVDELYVIFPALVYLQYMVTLCA